MKILAFGASNSSTSINRQLATYVAHQINNAEVTLLDLNDFEMPIYSIDREKESGIPSLAETFKQHVREADKIIISLAEHNGSYTVAFKNIMDWISRIEGDTWENKPFFLLSTSPGARGGASVLETAVVRFGYLKAVVTAHFSLPKFYDNFDESLGITDPDLNKSMIEQLNIFIGE